MQNATFDIFAGELETEAIWVEAVTGLDNAKSRMDQIASGRPGKYFIFYSADHSVLARTETFESSESPQKITPASP